ncbi:MAG TPA: sulfite exporter TauE/SafE family protein [Candidatus Eisenbacteria bacterium]|jgi:uncharacterized membrane protein YfcA
MTPLEFTAGIAGVSIVAGLFGSLLGLGGGILVIPALTLLFHVDIRYAIGASIVSVIATSSGAAAAYVRDRITNLRVAMFLEVATVTGALAGAFLAGRIHGRWLYLTFGLALLYSALSMVRKPHGARPSPGVPDPLADRLGLHGSYFDEAVGREVAYRVRGTGPGLGFMFLAGGLSGLLGIGAGAFKVPAMDLAMGLPIKVSTATSNFMIGVTAAASAGVYFARGDVDPFIAAPVAVGVLLGAMAGSRLLSRLHGRAVRWAFVLVLAWIAAQMITQGLR